jgi:hypothetical protein
MLKMLELLLNERRRFEPFSFGNLLVWHGFERKPLDNRHSWVKCLYGLDVRKPPRFPCATTRPFRMNVPKSRVQTGRTDLNHAAH